MALTLDDLKSMKIADYIAAFKDKATWRKANYILVLFQHTLTGKKQTVALPFKLAGDAKAALKRIKSEKIHNPAKAGLGRLKVEKGEGGTEKAVVELFAGGLAVKTVQKPCAKLFEKMTWGFECLLGQPSPEEMDPDMQAPPAEASPEDEAAAAAEAAETEEQTPPVSTKAEQPVATANQELVSWSEKSKTALQRFKNEWVPAFQAKQWNPQLQQALTEALDTIRQFVGLVANLPTLPAVLVPLKTAADNMLQLATNMLKAGTANNTQNPAVKVLSGQMKDIYDGMRNAKEVVLVNYKARKSTPEELQGVRALLQTVETFLAQSAAPDLQSLFAKQRSEAEQFAKQLQTLAQNIVELLRQAPTDTNTKAQEKAQMKERVQQIRNRITEIRQLLQQQA